jgi:dihydrodipicolinate synthase/N-acetylneuraminate lyase
MIQSIQERLQAGGVIPAHPLALTPDKTIDIQYQKALTRYYISSGAAGLAVGVHTTQFAIHAPEIGLYKPVLQLAMETAREYCGRFSIPMPIMIAGIVGDTKPALREAEAALNMGYDIGLVSLTAFRGRSIDEMISHIQEVGKIIPIMGFYLQEAISGMRLPREFWSGIMEIPALAAIKIAPFNRYQTLDVMEALAYSGRHEEIALYTGNDDHIILDLLSRFHFRMEQKAIEIRFKGGLLGQWACWTHRAVQYHRRIQEILEAETPIPQDLVALGNALTLANKAIFDADHYFTGCIPGISYVLKNQGLMRHVATLDPAEKLSPGQAAKIDQILEQYPELNDDEFVRQNLPRWID